MIELVMSTLCLFGSSPTLTANTPTPDIADCYTKLSVDEKTFLAILSPYNQQLFCSKFTRLQRRQAMEMTGWLDTNGNPMTADQAVQQTAQNNGIMIDMPPLEPPCAPSVQPGKK